MPPLSPITGGGWRQAALLHAGPRQCGALQAITATPTATGPSVVRCAPGRSRRFSNGGFAGGLRPHGRLRRHRFAAGLRHPTGGLRSICYGRQSPRRHSNKVWPPSSRRPDPRGDWRSVQVRFEFVNPEHLALNSGSGSLQPPVEILWRAYCRADLGPPDWWRTRRGVQGRPRPVLRLPRRRTRRATLRARGPR